MKLSNLTRKTITGISAIAIAQALLLGCASTRKNTAEEDAQLAKVERTLQRAEGRAP